jgi:integrase
MRGSNRLTARHVATLKDPGRYGDGGGLWLQISTWGTKAWIFRFTMQGRARHMGLGPVDTLSLAEARDKARDARKLVLDGIDPIEQRKAVQKARWAETAKQITFRDAAQRYIDAHKAGWRNPKHASQWSATLELYAYPVVGTLPVGAVDTALVLKILEPIWSVKTETASRLRGRIEAVLDWATARHYRQGENPARWRGHLDKLLPAKTKVRKVRHHDAMPYVDIPAFMAELRRQDCISAHALEFTILTAARTGETVGATWDEIDLLTKVWTIPGERTKSGREHRVPLSDRAAELLGKVSREDKNPFVFLGQRAGQGLSNMAMLQLLRGMKGDGLTVHGFRSTFRDWAAEETNFPREVAEAALAHVLRDKTEAAYRRGDALEKRRRLMQAWARHCEAPPREQRGAGTVIPLQANG